MSTAPPLRLPREALGRSASRSAVVNGLTVVLGAVTGIVAAKVLGAQGRGAYAAVMTWYVLVKILGELGLPVGITYFTAQQPAAARALVDAAWPRLLASSAVLTGGAWATALLLVRSPVVAACTAIAFTGLVVAAWGNARLAVLQALDNPRWNVGRALQPVAYLLLVLAVVALGRASPEALFWCLLVSLVVSSVVLTRLARPWLQGRGGAGADRSALQRYSAHALAGTLPNALNARVDQLFLSFGDLAALGTYALAVAVVTLVLPLGLGVGSALLPHLASGVHMVSTTRTVTRALLATAVLSAAVLVPLVPLSASLVPGLFGSDFTDFGLLVVLLAPGSWASGVALVAANAVNGLGAPARVARVEVGTTALLVVALLVAVPHSGAVGAAVASTGVAVVRLAWLLAELGAGLRGARSGTGPEPSA